LELADEDIVMAEYALSQGIFRQTCFHAQQAVEKALKGLLGARLGTHPKSHSLEQLLLYDSGIHNEFRRWRTHCRSLDRFYIPTRYADALPGLLPSGEPTQEDAQEALRDAKAMVVEIREKIGGKK
jgi:HEPN domain-containing protein